MERAAAKVGKVPQVAEALPHSEGAAYKGYATKSQRACGTGGWGRISNDGLGQNNPDRSEDPWGRGAQASRMTACNRLEGVGLRANLLSMIGTCEG